MSPAPPTPVERIAMYVAALSGTVASHTGWDQILTLSLIAEIINRLREIKFAFTRLADRIQAGTWRPRRCGPRRPPATGRPRKSLPPRKKFGWPRPLLPEANPYGSQFFALLHDAPMRALLDGAPPSLGRPLRSLCWMLGIKPPSFLPPARPRPARPQKPPASPPPPRPVPIPPKLRAAPARAAAKPLARRKPA